MNTVKTFIAENKLESSIEYRGLITNADKESFFSRGDCLVLPSYSEGFPLTILEAMKYNKAIITTDVSDLKSLFSDTINFCDRKDSKSLLAAMLKIKENYKPSDLKYEKHLSNYNIDFVAKKIIALIDVEAQRL